MLLTLAVLPLLGSCTTFNPDSLSDGTTVLARPAISGDQCDGAISIVTTIQNNIDESRSFHSADDGTPPGIVGMSISSEVAQLLDDRISLEKAFVSQSEPDTCYAAALATIWRASGDPAVESDFTHAVHETCPAKRAGGANFAQIMSAAYYMHTNKPGEILKTKTNPFGFVGRTYDDGEGNKLAIGVRAVCLAPPFCILIVGGTKLKGHGANQIDQAAPDSKASSEQKYSEFLPIGPSFYTNGSFDGLEWKSRTPAFSRES